MHLTSIALLLSAIVSISAHPAAIEESAAIEARQTADAACTHFDTLVGEQVSEMAKLNAQNISIPPYLAGYYSAVNSGRQEIGCPSPVFVGKRDWTPLQEPCDVIDDQHSRMWVLITKFESQNIGIAPFISGFYSATLDGSEALSCPAFTNEGDTASSTDTTAVGTS